uniref:Uncharacterized protein n=1 Tax=Cucumis melo TaxID=3656 RepID=A0A9I9ECY8_CUCME
MFGMNDACKVLIRKLLFMIFLLETNMNSSLLVSNIFCISSIFVFFLSSVIGDLCF